ncbi:MAG: SDR family NAD(P)-dependent oxidoreductase [Myxococcales bacterium]|nr:SDR family NAD(P)-dependent oxidoreductase [Myxococcales bacterium]MDH5306906.1 SDR family NAD(P)-dependent oxidoreductase [Myxococcales bacterium]MDH5565115.1 SDR family NAD(P)-dependent oxidoreductase [Myxococcales bacterium]
MGSTALVTGASSGIGAATARVLAQRGFEVFGTSRRPEALPPEAPTGIHWLGMDVRDEASVGRAVAQLLDTGSGLDALVCNAGCGIFGSVEEVPLEAARAQFETNFFGTLCTLRAALPHLRARGSGRVVLVGSLAGRAPIPFQAHYSASKAAIEALALALRNELHPLGVRVSLVEPGDIRTAFNDAVDFGDPQASAYRDRIARCQGVIEKTMSEAPGPEIVANAIHRALTARRPRVRYAVGPESRRVPLGRRLLPDALALRLIRAHFRV